MEIDTYISNFIACVGMNPRTPVSLKVAVGKLDKNSNKKTRRKGAKNLWSEFEFILKKLVVPFLDGEEVE